MNVSTMRRIDGVAGAVACRVLTMHRRIFGRMTPPVPGEARRILFVKLAEQGTTVLAAGTIRRAVAKVGRENVFIMVFEENRFILDILDLIPPRNVICISSDSFSALAISIAKAVRLARRVGVDTVVDMEFFARASAVLSYLTGAPRRVGFVDADGFSRGRGDLLTHRVPFDPALHVSRTFRALADAAGLAAGESSEECPSISSRREDVEKVRDLLHEEGVVPAEGPILVMHPNPLDILPLRRWPGERYVELAKRMVERYPGALIVFTGMPTEREAVGRMVDEVASARCVNLAGKTTLREFLALCSIAQILIASDCGPTHFAGMTPVNTIALFGPETPALFGPLSPRCRVLQAGLECSPCFSVFNGRTSDCRDNLCLKRISVDEVEAAVVEILESRQGKDEI